jgi:hypothetical protein
MDVIYKVIAGSFYVPVALPLGYIYLMRYMVGFEPTIYWFLNLLN